MHNLTLYDVRKDPFDIYGLYRPKEEAEFKRLPDDSALAASHDVANHSRMTAGGRVRFTTDSSKIGIKAVMPSITRMPQMALTGSSGFDLYVDKTYYANFLPPYDMTDGYEFIMEFSSREKRNITIHFPLYNYVNSLFVGLEENSFLDHGMKYAYPKPILYYGSSITQGGCASRPGNSYQNIISANLDCDHINLGFSGSAKAEDAIVEYMASLDFSIFVSDYDYNADTVEYLKATHEKMFLKMREAHPNKPIILISKPDFDNNVTLSILRRDVIYQTYMNAISRSDKNVYFIDGQRLFMDSNRDACTVDGVHPNDAGFVRMANVIGSVIERILRKGNI